VDRPILRLHPDATNCFNADAEKLVLRLSPEQKTSETRSVVPPDALCQQRLRREISLLTALSRAMLTSLIEIPPSSFMSQMKAGWDLKAKRIAARLRLAQSMQRLPELYQYLSCEFLEDQLFLWIKSKYLGKAASGPVDYVLQAGMAAITEQEIWLPIPTLSTTVAFSIGKIEFIRSDLQERLELTKEIRAVYAVRSAFVHRSLPVRDLELLGRFMIDAMAAFRKLLLAAAVYSDKEHFLRDLDHHRLSGPSFHPLA
jgi:hypothetical protein